MGKDHKVAIITSVIIICLLLLSILAVYTMFNPKGSKSRQIDVEVSEEVINSIISEITSSSFVSSAKFEKNETILKFFIDVKSDSKESDIKALSNIIIDKLKKEVTTSYDIEIYVNGDLEICPMIGYHSKKALEFTWVLNKGDKE